MRTAKLFMNGKSQAVRLPKECRFPGDEVYIFKTGNSVMIVPKDQRWETFLKSLEGFTDDFGDAILSGRQDNRWSERESL